MKGKKKVIEIPYKPYPHQVELHNLCKDSRFVVVVMARRSGKTVAAINELIARALTATDGRGRFAYIAPTYRQAKRIAWDYVKQFSRCVPMIKFKENELSADFPNGSRIQLYGIDSPDSLRGQYADMAILDEYGMFPETSFDLVIRPSLADRLGSCIFMGTPNGRANDFFRKFEYAAQDNNWRRMKVGWKEARTIAPLEARAMKETMTDEEYSQELLAEFTSAVRGAYYAEHLNKAQESGRITTVAYDPKIPVHTFWDIGIADATAIWFVQFANSEIRLIEYMEESGQGLEWYLRRLQEREYIYGEHYAPWDIKVREMSTGMSRIEIAQSLGLHFNVVPKLPVQDGINATRSIFHRLWIDENECSKGLSALYNYRREYDEKKGAYKPKAVHDWSSHAADALRYMALSVDNVTNTAGIIAGTRRVRVHSSLH